MNDVKKAVEWLRRAKSNLACAKTAVSWIEERVNR